MESRAWSWARPAQRGCAARSCRSSRTSSAAGWMLRKRSTRRGSTSRKASRIAKMPKWRIVSRRRVGGRALPAAEPVLRRRERSRGASGRLARRRGRPAPRRSGRGDRVSQQLHRAPGGPVGRGSADASGGSSQLGAGSVADLNRRRVAQRRRRAAVSEGGAAVSACRRVSSRSGATARSSAG